MYRDGTDDNRVQPNIEQQTSSECTEDAQPELLTNVAADANSLVAELTAQLQIGRSHIQQLQLKLAATEEALLTSNRHCVAYATISTDEKLVAHFTGLPNASMFNVLLQLCQRFDIQYYLGWRVETIPPDDQLFITLRKIRTNVSLKTLAWEYKVSETTITNVVMTWLHILWEVLVDGMMNRLPSRQQNARCLPQSFATFTNCRTVVDCTEIRCAIPKQFAKQSMTYSHYKHYHTLKGLVAVAPNAVITFVSQLYPGSTSDKAITQHCGIIDQLEAGDMVLADKGFLLSDILPAGVTVNIPPFLNTSQFSKEQCILTRNIARARIHVERANARIKRFKILEFIPHYYRDISSKLFQVCAALVNFQNPLLSETEDRLL